MELSYVNAELNPSGSCMENSIRKKWDHSILLSTADEASQWERNKYLSLANRKVQRHSLHFSFVSAFSLYPTIFFFESISL